MNVIKNARKGELHGILWYLMGSGVTGMRQRRLNTALQGLALRSAATARVTLTSGLQLRSGSLWRGRRSHESPEPSDHIS